jgi:hypothetical protein
MRIADSTRLPRYAFTFVLDLVGQPLALARRLGGLPSLQLRLRLRQLREDRRVVKAGSWGGVDRASAPRGKGGGDRSVPNLSL